MPVHTALPEPWREAPPAEEGAEVVGVEEAAASSQHAEAAAGGAAELRTGGSDEGLCFVCLGELAPEQTAAARRDSKTQAEPVLRTLPCLCKGSVGSVHLSCFRRGASCAARPLRPGALAAPWRLAWSAVAVA